MTVLALGIVALRGDPLSFFRVDPDSPLSRWLLESGFGTGFALQASGHAIALLAGLVLAFAVIAHTRMLVSNTRWARSLHENFRRLLGPLEPREIAVLAVTSGVAEEFFFRGALQPWLGLPVASLLFGAVHLGPTRSFFSWTLWATLMGFAFGGLTLVTGSLLAPIVAHVVINHENLHFIEAFAAPRSLETATVSRRGALPALVAIRRRATDPGVRR